MLVSQIDIMALLSRNFYQTDTLSMWSVVVVKIQSCTITQKYLSDCYEIAYTYSSHGGVHALLILGSKDFFEFMGIF